MRTINVLTRQREVPVHEVGRKRCGPSQVSRIQWTAPTVLTRRTFPIAVLATALWLRCLGTIFKAGRWFGVIAAVVASRTPTLAVVADTRAADALTWLKLTRERRLGLGIVEKYGCSVFLLKYLVGER